MRGGNISVDLLDNPNFMNKLKMNYLKTTTKNNSLNIHIFFFQISPHFPLRGNVGQPSKKTGVLCLSMYIVQYIYYT